jgi:hypothetical protein
MDISSFHAAGRIVIEGSPEDLYDFIADMPRMGEISSQCTGGEWQSDDRGAGAHFLGSNKRDDHTWRALQRVQVADRGREFAWENIGAKGWEIPLVRWGYTFEPVDGGTQVEETWRILQSYPQLEALDDASRAGMPGYFASDIRATLAKLKVLFESGPGAEPTH